MGGLADALAMQGRLGDSTLVHMNPMEVRMLETMSPDGRLSINPETGLPEAFKLKDIASFALPIAAGAFLGPAAAGLLGTSALTGTAVATGFGGVGAGLLRGKGVKDALVEGGLSGLMSYGLGSLSGAFAPSGGVTAGPPTQATMAASGPGLMSTAPDTVGAVTTAAAPEPTGFFGGLGETLKQTPFTDVPSVGSPTYGSMLGSGASGLLSSSLLAPEEMPYDIAGMDDTDAYYPSRIPDLEAGRRRGRAAARSLNYPPSGSTGSQYYGMATSPSGFGTFYAAEGGPVSGGYTTTSGPLSSSDLYQEATGSGINLRLPQFLPQAAPQTASTYVSPYGQPVDPYGGLVVDDGGNTSQDGGMSQGPSNSGGSLGQIGQSIDVGLGIANPSPIGMAASLAGIALGVPGLGPAVAVGRGLASMMGEPETNALGQTQSYGFGNQSIDAYGNTVGSMSNVASEMNMDNQGFDAADDVEGMDDVSGSGPGSSGAEESGWAQGGVVEAGIGGLLKALSPAALATDTLGIADVDKLKTKDMLGMLSPAAFFAKDPKRLKYLSPAYMASQKPSALSPAATIMMNRGMAQGGGISSLAYGGESAPVGFANRAFEGMVPGQGTGMSDDVPFSIEGNQPALLSRDEYVLPADVVSQLGDGSSGAGADMLDNFISQVRQTKYGNTQQPAPVGPQLMTGLMRQGGVV